MTEVSNDQAPDRLYFVLIEFAIQKGREIVRSGSSASFVSTASCDMARTEATLACHSQLIEKDVAVLMRVVSLEELSAEAVAVLQGSLVHARPQAEIDVEQKTE
jgi:hypothetical protein